MQASLFDIGAGIAKSPLRYPGGKSRAVRVLLPIVQDIGPRKVCSPFLGGGSLELALVSAGVPVDGFDLFRPLANFWRMAMGKRRKVVDRVWRLFEGMDAAMFRRLQRKRHRDGAKAAADFFALNRASFSGLTVIGGMGRGRFTESSVERLAAFGAEGLAVGCADFEDSIAAHPGHFLFLDPPYRLDNPALYGRRGELHRDFGHYRLAKVLRARRNWMLCYNDCRWARAIYKKHRIESAEWAYGMNKSKASSEIIIYSRDLS